jgi:hypothetical protein
LEDGGERLSGEKSLVASVAASGVPSYLLDVPQVSEKDFADPHNYLSQGRMHPQKYKPWAPRKTLKKNEDMAV